MSAIMIIAAYVLFIAGVVFLAWEIFIHFLSISFDEPRNVTNWLVVMLFVSAAIAKYIAS